jgi:hypothetical protein
MSNYQVLKRLERIERAAKANPRFLADCICFPRDEKEPVVLYLPIEAEMILSLLCPIHGVRCEPRWFIYEAMRFRKDRWPQLWTHHSPQFRKAWLSTFPPPLWPAEEEIRNGEICLRLKDGTMLASGRKVPFAKDGVPIVQEAILFVPEDEYASDSPEDH